MSRSATRRLSPIYGHAISAARHSTAQRSPAKRVLSNCSDNGNASPSPPDFLLGVESENKRFKSPAPIRAARIFAADGAMDVEPTPCDKQVVNHPNRIFGRRERAAHLGDTTIKSSPLKRSDTSVNLGYSPSGSPSAKRRSVHGVSYGADFDIFDQVTASGLDIESSSNNIQQEQFTPTFASPIPRRNGSLRKAALQQRHDRPSRPRIGLDTWLDTSSPQLQRTRARTALDNSHQPPRESLFSSQAPLPNASVHPIIAPRRDAATNFVPVPSQRHPLSRTITQSSSGSSFTDDSPTTISQRQNEARRVKLDFTRSLPLNAMRPATVPVAPETQSSSSSQDTQYATPENYRFAKPLAQAFMSTGLISKRNKNIEPEQFNAGESFGHMPDTPCKRPFSLAAMSPGSSKPTDASHAKQIRHTLHSFGTPSTPFNHCASTANVTFGAGNSIFGSSFKPQMTRRGSFLAADIPAPSGPAAAASPPESQVTGLPTPRKLSGTRESLPRSESRSVRQPDAKHKSEDAACELTTSFFESSSDEETDGLEHVDISTSPSARVRPQSIISNGRVDDKAEPISTINSPTPLSKSFNAIPFSRRRATRTPALPSDAPHILSETSAADLPQTPAAEMQPPDPSRLSISANAHGHVRHETSYGGFPSFFPPATPTTNRESFHRASHKSSLTPIQQVQAAQVDESITSRFDRVELIGLGEFSSVFRGIKYEESAHREGIAGHASISGTAPARSWAVKKTRNAYLGQRDRKRKLQEVEILRLLGRSEHVIEFVDSWEFNQHLYIQTEYCEEGGLDVFLEKVGRKARLDDFRIWKILLELSQVSHAQYTLF